MLVGYGWCVLRSSRDQYRAADIDSVDRIDDQVVSADRELWSQFRQWMATHDECYIKWDLHECLNNHHGILMFCVSRNHRASLVWNMVHWIADHGAGSYGLLYVHDDEDAIGNTDYGRGTDDFSNAFRVHRILNGRVTEMSDPFFSPIVPTLNPRDLA
jgi:hypothetical protein